MKHVIVTSTETYLIIEDYSAMQSHCVPNLIRKIVAFCMLNKSVVVLRCDVTSGIQVNDFDEMCCLASDEFYNFVLYTAVNITYIEIGIIIVEK